VAGEDYIRIYNKWADALSDRWIRGDQEAVLNEMFRHTPEKAAFAALNIYYDLIEKYKNSPIKMMRATREFSLAIRERLTPEGVLTLKVEH
jgi:hypothetical protein